MNDEKLASYIQIVNRESGDIESVITTKKQYVKVYSQMVAFPDVENAIKVWCDLTKKSRRELLKEFSLAELTNTFSTTYFARVIRKGQR